METPKSTPGPWVLDGETCDEMGDGELAVRGADGSIVAGVWPHGDDVFGEEVQRLNGRLIADAPKMRAALEDATQWHASDRPNLEFYLFKGRISLRLDYQDRPAMVFKFRDAGEARLIAAALIKKAEQLDAGEEIA